MEQLTSLLLGPMGGGIALGFGLGASAGYTFANRITNKFKLPALEEKLDDLAAELDHIRDDLRTERERLQKIETLIIYGHLDKDEDDE